jgi:hypothetical protein
MIKSIDHIIIHTPDAKQTLQEIEEAFGLKAYVPITDYGYFTSAIVRFGNTDIELLEMGDKKDFKPYLYGLALEGHKEPWALLEDLNAQKIAHTLPFTTRPKNSFLSWTTLSLKGLLDNPTPTAYGLSSKNFFTTKIAKFFDWLFSKDAIAKAMIKDIGESAVFFVNYHDDFKKPQMDIETLSINAIMIERISSNDKWEMLGQPSDGGSPKLAFIESDKNRLSHIVLNSDKEGALFIGDVKFVFKK